MVFKTGRGSKNGTKISAGCCSGNIILTTMKIITLHKRINKDELFTVIQKHLNPLFREQRKMKLDFNIEQVGNVINISQEELYPGDILYHIEVKGDELHITRCEHYVDDVNSLTVESILNDLFNNLSGTLGTDLILEG
jgi:hypothetical protein